MKDKNLVVVKNGTAPQYFDALADEFTVAVGDSRGQFVQDKDVLIFLRDQLSNQFKPIFKELEETVRVSGLTKGKQDELLKAIKNVEEALSNVNVNVDTEGIAEALTEALQDAMKDLNVEVDTGNLETLSEEQVMLLKEVKESLTNLQQTTNDILELLKGVKGSKFSANDPQKSDGELYNSWYNYSDDRLYIFDEDLKLWVELKL